MREGSEAQEELGSVRVRPRVRHREDSRARVLVDEVLVREGAAVDRLTACAVADREVATLGHEARDDPMEVAPFVVERLSASSLPLLTSAEGTEVLRSFWSVGVQAHDDTPSVLLANGYVKEYSRGDHICF